MVIDKLKNQNNPNQSFIELIKVINNNYICSHDISFIDL